MKRNILYTLFIISFCLSKQISAQCDLPSGEVVNTGSNMTVMLLPDFISSLPITHFSSYMVAHTPDGLLVGSQVVAGVSQTQIAIWGDDASTVEVDGAGSGEAISFQLVVDNELYDIEMPTSVSYTTNSFLAQPIATTYTLNCGPTYCEDSWLTPFVGNTGSNMTMMLTETFVLSLNAQSEDAYIVATTQNGLVVGSSNVADVQTSLAIWADDIFTSETDGATEGESIELSLIDGAQMYSIDYTFNFVTNAVLPVDIEVSLTSVCEAQLPLGCADSGACNYDATANTDDGTCTYVDGICETCEGGVVVDNDSDNDGLCDSEDILSGCIDATACNYNSSTTLNEDNTTCTYLDGVCDTCVDGLVVDNDSDDDGLCDSADILSGCVDAIACNYDTSSTINQDNASCIYATGCEACSGVTDGTGTIVDQDADDDNVCDDVDAFDDDPTESEDTDGDGVGDNTDAFPEDENESLDSDQDGLGDNADVISGCKLPEACNYNSSPTLNEDNASCITPLGCDTCSGETDGTGIIIDNDADDDGVCDADEVEGCTDVTACNYDATSTTDTNNALCNYATDLDACASCSGEQDGTGVIVDNDADDDSICNADELEGCTDATACNYNSSTTIDTVNVLCNYALDLDACASCSGEQDGSGVIVDNDADDDAVCDADEIDGCRNDTMFNYNTLATDEDDSCYPVIDGCMDVTAFNYDAPIGDVQLDVNTDDNSCYPVVYGCNDPIALNYNDLDDDGIGDDLIIDGDGVNVNTDDGSCIAYILGCTNINSCNYQANAVHNIALCDFPPVYYSCDTIEFTSETYVYEISCINDADADGVCDENEVEGCASSSIACNYNPDASDEVECVFADQFLDCSGNCLVDSDQDGVCDELEILGCIDNVACNYNENATEDDGVCEYAVENYNCDGTCVDDTDGDGICDLFEVSGCTSDWAENFNDQATDDDGSCILEGCTNDNYIEYNANATDDNGSCEQLIVYGCTLSGACNYNEEANTPDGSCAFPAFEYVACDGSCINGEDSEGNCIQFVVEGCMDEFACNYSEEANLDTNPTSCTYVTEFIDCNGDCFLDEDDDQVCDQLEIFGCAEVNACNYNSASTESSACLYPAENYLDCNNQCINDVDADGICDQFDMESCGDDLALNFNPFATEVNNDLCEYPDGCTDPIAANYDSSVMIDDGSCITELIGCADADYLEFNSIANINHQESCVTLVVLGCMDPNAIDYNPEANINNYVCNYSVVVGCMNPDYLEFNPQATEDSDPTLCVNEIAFGCTNSNYLEYDSSANVDNGTCQSIEYEGCLNQEYQEYNVLFTVHKQSDCITPHIYGCTNSFSVGSSYNPSATIDDGSCILIGCSDTTFAEYYTQGYTPNVVDEAGVYNSTFCVNPALLGCINSYAINYNSLANVATDDCVYEDGDYIDFQSDVTDISCSILIPNYGSADVNGSNVSFSGEFTESFPEGSTIGVFYHDYNGMLQCGGSSIWSSTSTNSISAYIDDIFTTAKDGFNENEAFNWRVQTPHGLLYSINVLINENSLTGNQFSANGLVQVGHMYTQFMYQVEIPGCMDPAYVDYNQYANSPRPCYVLKDVGCMDLTAFNYNLNATEDDGSCYPEIYGCNDLSAFNYVQPIGNLFVDPNTDDGTCIPVIEGCLTDIYAYNYSPITGNPLTDVNTDNGSCYARVLGCTDIPALNFNDLDADGSSDELTGQNGVDVNTDDGSCIQKIFGCVDETMFNYNPDANVDNGVCYPVITGCVDDQTALNYFAHTGNPYLDVNDTVACILPVYGCMDPLAYNYVDTATVHDQSCISRVYACTDNGISANTFGDVNDLLNDGLTAFNYNPLANTDDGSCYPVIEGCTVTTAFNFNNYGLNKDVSYAVSGDEFTDVNTSDNSCVTIKVGCLDVNAYNYNDFDLDGESNSLLNPQEDVNTHLQSECFYRPGCTDPTYAQYWNYSIIEGLETTMYPDSMLDANSCVDLADFFCNDPGYVESYVWNGFMWLSYDYPNDISLVPNQLECLNERVDYCVDTNFVGYYFTNNITDGTDIEAGANFGIPKVIESFANLENDLNPGNEPLCGEEVSFYCNDSDLTGYYLTDNVADGTMQEADGGNIIDDNLCGAIQVDMYCEDASSVGYYNVNENGDYDFNLGHNSGNIIDASLCGDNLIKYCDNPAFVGYYLGDSVGVQNVGTIIDNLETCGDSAVFYCNDSSYLGYYTGSSEEGGISSGTHVDNSLDYCIELANPYCSDSTFFEYYVDTLMSDAYTGNIVNDGLCTTLIVPGCTDESMFNYDAVANINRTSLENDSDPCYPIVYGCVNIESFNFNNYYSTHNTNPATGQLYQDGDVLSAVFGPKMAQASILESSYYDGTGNGINVNTSIPTDPSTVNGGGCIPIVYGCTDDQALNFNDWSPAATEENAQYGDGIADSWNYENPWLNVNTDDGSCIGIITGCKDLTACNYLETANADDGNCVFPETYYDCDTVCVNDIDSDGVCDELEVVGCTDASAFNFNSAATDEDGSCITIVLGCMSEGYFNYDSLANVDSGNCEDFIFGCTDATAFNYNSFANTSTNFTCYPVVEGCMFEGAYNYNDYDGDGASNSLTGVNGVDVNTNDGSCIASVFGCTDSLAFNFDSLANTDNGICIELVTGCTNVSAENYNSAALQDDGSCIYGGCTDPMAFNYNADVDVDDGSCIVTVKGCMIPEAFNYDSLANVPGFCIDVVLGCTDPLMYNYNPQANTDNESCIPVIPGCTNPNAIGYDPEQPANTDDGSCVIVVEGCTDSTAVNYQDFANTPNGSCLYLGCTVEGSANFNSQANIDDGTCIASVDGCTDSTAFNFNPIATNNSEQCIPIVEGCLHPFAYNFEPNANVSNGLCEPFIYGCTTAGSLNYNPKANVNQVSENDHTDPCIANIPGCMYSEAFNFNPDATVSDNSCVLNIPGCMDVQAINYNEYATIQPPESCSYIIEIVGCMNENASNYDLNATAPSGACLSFIYGCTTAGSLNYNSEANAEDGSCISVLSGCTSPLYIEFNPVANTEDGSCSELIIYGCMDSGNPGFDFDGDGLPAYNFDSNANVDTEPSSCLAQVVGCNIPGMPCFDADVNTAAVDIVESCFYSCNTRSSQTRSDTTFFCSDPLSSNYNLFFDSLDASWNISPFNPVNAGSFDCSYNTDGYDIYCTDGSQIFVLDEDKCEFVEGCTDNGSLANGLGEVNDVNIDGLPAFNYNPNAVVDDGSCEAIVVGCSDSNYLEYNAAVNTSNAAFCITEIEYGCTDANSFNYNPEANEDDGSCTPIVLGCMDTAYLEYSAEANTAVLDEFDVNQMCVTPIVNGCTDPDYLEYWNYDSGTFEITDLIPAPNTQIEGACVSLIVLGCADPAYIENWNYNSETYTITALSESPNVNDGSCATLIVEGCTDFGYLEYNSDYNVEDNSCVTSINPGCTNTAYLEYFDFDSETHKITVPDPVYNIGSDGDYCETLIVYGCTNSLATNYNMSANVDQISAEDATSTCTGGSGCTNSSANNYNASAVIDDGSCIIDGCTNSTAENFNEDANQDDGSCIILGCNEESALNYDASVTHSDGSCIYEYIYGCMDPAASNYDNTVTVNQISAEDVSDPCIPYVYGCTDVTYVEYFDYSYSDSLQFVLSGPVSIPNTDNGSCATLIIEGCTDANYFDYSSAANTYQAEACIDEIVIGCTDATYLEYNASANYGDPSTFCTTLITNGCTDPLYLEYNEFATLDDGSCATLIVQGCMDVTSFNYDVQATVDDGSCIAVVTGCTDNGFNVNGNGEVNDLNGDGIAAFNYNSQANTDDASCIPVIEGCTDIAYVENWSWNPVDFSITALENPPNTDDGSCSQLLVTDCTDSNYMEYNSQAHLSDASLCLELIINGCMDSLFVEYHTQGYVANIDDGSCLTDVVYGCTDSQYLQYYGFIEFVIPVDIVDYEANLNTDSVANVDDGSCQTSIVIGCYNAIATNHNPSTTVHDISICEGAVGCTYDNYFEYDPLAIIDNGSCVNLIAYGCLDNGLLPNSLGEINDVDGDELPAFNYDSEANVDNESCYPIVEGCLDDTYYNYNDYDYDDHPNVLTEVGGVDVNTNNIDFCVDIVNGCTDNGIELNGANLINDIADDESAAYNYNSLANTDDGSCYPVILGCMDTDAYNFNDYDFDGVGNYFTSIDGVDVNTAYETSNCIPKVFGCFNDSTAYNYNDYDKDGEGDPVTGTMGIDVNTDDDSCFPYVTGCMDTEAFNYNDYDYDAIGNALTGIDGTDVNTADDSCFPVIIGCLDTNAFNYNDVDADGNSNNITGDNFIDINTHDPSTCAYLGCTNFTAANYDTYGMVLTSFGEFVPATIDDGSCVIPGCTLNSFPNYNSEATVEDGSCDMNSLDVFGCTDDNYLEYNSNATIENGSCEIGVIYGCTNETMFNYSLLANTDDGTCVEYIYGCMDDSYLEYSSAFNSSEPLDCITPIVLGCINSIAENYDELANTDDGSCEVLGCTDAAYVEYSDVATIDDGSCITVAVLGCMDSNYLEYWDWDYSEYNAQLYILFAPINDNINTDDGSCSTELIYGCFYDVYVEYNANTNVFDVSFCQNIAVNGCTDSLASNYDETANVDDDSCEFEGCTNPLAFNYNSNVNTDDGSCVPYIYGCTIIDEYLNYNPAANVDDGTCSDTSADIIGCSDSLYFEYDTNVTVHSESYCENFMVFGCMDEEMYNYDAAVNFDDDSCIPFVDGCTNVLYLEFDTNANSDDGSCVTVTIPGCTDPLASNYNDYDGDGESNALTGTNGIDVNFDDGSCIAIVEGCTDSNYLEYNSDATDDDGSCTTVVISGCTDSLYVEYYSYTQNIEGVYVLEEAAHSNVNFNDGSCQTFIVADCVYDDYVEYNPEANVSVPDSCVTIHTSGCMNEIAYNYDENATLEDGSCLIIVAGCMDAVYVEYNSAANLSVEDSCITVVNEGIYACNNPDYAQYYSYELSPIGLFIIGDVLNDGANVDYGCSDLLVHGCTYNQYVEYNPVANVYDFEGCNQIVNEGCTDATALNHDSLANTDDGTCVPNVPGCMDPLYVEYNANATVDDETCSGLIVYGCTDSTDFNYNPLANTNDFSCLPTIYGCLDAEAFNYNPLANVDNGVCVEVVSGCTDNGLLVNGANMIKDADGDLISAFNYNPDANTDDGSCESLSYGCLDEFAYNFNLEANTDDDSCIEVVLGCIDPAAFNYESIANTDDESCYPVLYGCLDSLANNYNDYDGDLIGNPFTGDVQIDVNTDNGVCIGVVLGCTDPAAQNFNQSANNDDASCEYTGCMNEGADNYNALATLPGFCQFNGCTDPTAINYNPQANEDDGTCIPVIEGCNYQEYLEYDPAANVNDGSCLNIVTYGCMNDVAMNYNPAANVNQVSFEDTSSPCIGYVFGCTDNGLLVNGLDEINDANGDDLSAFNYNSNANTEDGSCIAALSGCMNPNSLNYDSEANTSDGSCIPFIWGCTDTISFNFNVNANSDDGSCYEVLEGCMNPLAYNYNSIANSNDGSCIPFIYGCIDETALNYNPLANSEDGSCIDVVLGCMNPLAANYDPPANSNDGSCIAVIYGCTDPGSVNYNENATIDNGNCVAIISGCTNPFASNFNVLANQDNGSCVFVLEGCTDESMFNYDVNATADDGSCTPVTYGCIWSFADNYDSEANTDDGSCTFGRLRANDEVCINPIAENYFPYLDPSSPSYQSGLEGLYPVDNSTCEYIYGCTDPSAYNYASNATIDDDSCVDEANVLIGCMDEGYLEYNAAVNVHNMTMCLTQIVEGCTNFNAANFNPLANTNDGSCITEFIYGCMDAEALNYNPFANTPDGSCEQEGIFGCTDPNYLEYDQYATEDDATCATLIVYGCMESLASNYNSSANVSDDSCEYDGCLDAQADNYDPTATEDNGSCIYSGCTNSIACNYDNTANVDDGSCNLPLTYYDCASTCINDSDADGICNELEVQGCTDANACNYDASATDDGACTYAESLLDCNGICLQDQDSDGVCDELEIEGCIDPAAVNYEANATDIADCDYDGCIDDAYLEFDSNATVDVNNSCQTLIVNGCTNHLAENYDSEANTDDGTCNIIGCTNPNAENYNASANQDNASCIVKGCTDSFMFNYDAEANIHDGSCIPYIYGCNDETAFNYDAAVNTDDGSCEAVVLACIDETAFNYDGSANIDDGSCEPVVVGCLDSTAINYNSLVNTDDNSCTYPVYGCTNSGAENYNDLATDDDGSCVVYGCANSLALNYDIDATINDGTCVIHGCILNVFPNYNSEATIDDGSCEMNSSDIYGCSDQLFMEYDASVTIDNGSCVTPVVNGCTNLSAFNYQEEANTNDGTCYPFIEGCLDQEADNWTSSIGDVLVDINTSKPADCIYYGCTFETFPNYDSTANTDDGSCDMNSTDVFGCTDPLYVEYTPQVNQENNTCEVLIFEGCTDIQAYNYNENVNVDDNSCIAVIPGCTDAAYLEFDAVANTDNGSCVTLEHQGCTDLTAVNYDSLANVDDASCIEAVYGCMDPFYLEFNVDANIDTEAGTCNTLKVYGCVDTSYLEYWNHTQLPTGYYVIGDPINEAVNFDDGSCMTPITIGCVYDSFIEYNSEANVYESDDCATLIVEGCTSDWADNYNVDANVDDNSCYRVGCADVTACSYDELLTDTNNDLCIYTTGCETCSGETDGTGVVVDNDADDDGVCDADEVEGCTDDLACNYDATSTTDTDNTLCIYSTDLDACATCSGETDGTGTIVDNDADNDGVCDSDEVVGCQDDTACNYNVAATEAADCIYSTDLDVCATCSGETDGTGTIVDNDADNDGVCNADEIEGCMSDWADNYDVAATDDDASCDKLGCMSDWAENYDAIATTDNGSCYRAGCTNDQMFNYDSLATDDDDSCVPFVYGCMADSADNYDLQANIQVGITCDFTGCMDSEADNYLDVANIAADCEYWGCMDELACNYDSTANLSTECLFASLYYDCDAVCISDVDSDGVCDELEVDGCTDAPAANFNPLATEEDATCYYPLEVEYVVNHAPCKNGFGSLELIIAGGLEPIEINTFGLDLTAIPPGNGYVVYVSDASGNEYSFGGTDYNFTLPFDILAPEEQLQITIDFDEDDQEISFETNADNYDFTWHVNNVPSQAIDTELITDIENGLYGLYLRDDLGCSLYVDTLVETIGIEELTLESLEVYPNPTDGLVNIIYDLPQSKASTIRVISLAGKLLQTIELEESLRIETSLRLFDLSAGIYLLEIEVDERKLYRRLSIE